MFSSSEVREVWWVCIIRNRKVSFDRNVRIVWVSCLMYVSNENTANVIGNYESISPWRKFFNLMFLAYKWIIIIKLSEIMIPYQILLYITRFPFPCFENSTDRSFSILWWLIFLAIYLKQVSRWLFALELWKALSRNSQLPPICNSVYSLFRLALVLLP